MYHRPTTLIAGLFAVVLAGAVSSTSAAEETASVEWINQHPVVAKTKDITVEEYNSLKTIQCNPVTSHKKMWVNGWNSYLTDSSYPGCLVPMLDGYADTSNGEILLYGNKYNYPLSNSGVDRSIGQDYAMYPVANTSRIAFVKYSNSTMFITNNYRNTFGNIQKDNATNVFFIRDKDYDFTLKNAQGTPTGAASDTIAYSSNGRWMVVSAYANAWLRINLESGDYEILPFATPKGYGGYATAQAISNDGRFVAIYDPYNSFKVYDLNKCQPATALLASRNCEAYTMAYSDMLTLFKSQQTHFKNLKFSSSGNLEVYAASSRSSAWQYEKYQISVPGTETSTRYLALGDSFSSGEGAYDYRSTTDFYVDDNNYNLCHQSRASYPYLLQQSISPSWFGVVTCSGAIQRDINNAQISDADYLQNQAQAHYQNANYSFMNSVKTNVLPGYIPQSSFIMEYSPNVATISIGGNDIGFGDIVTACIVNKVFRQMQSCNTDRFDREQVANSIDAQIPKLAETFRTLKQSLEGEQKLYVIGYPKLVNYTNQLCSLNIPLDTNERQFADRLVEYLNEALRIAANQAGARFVNTSSAFVDADHDYRLCGDSDQKAVNGLMVSSDSSRKPGELAAHESFHPNQFGHSLLAQQIRLLTNDFSLDMPEPVAVSSTPSTQFRSLLVGDAVVTDVNKSVNYITDPISSLIISAGTQVLSTVKNAPGIIMQNTSATVELHSSPIIIGQVTVSTDNSISGNVTIPGTVEPGYHQLHILYTDSAGQEYDLYKYILVVASTSDYDGDGVMNDKEACVVGEASGIDSDKDGIDDACDGEYIAAKEDTSLNVSQDNSATQSTTNNTVSLRGLSSIPTSTIPNGSSVLAENILADTEELLSIAGVAKKDIVTMSASPHVSQKIANNTTSWLRIVGYALLVLLLLGVLCRLIVVKKTQ